MIRISNFGMVTLWAVAVLAAPGCGSQDVSGQAAETTAENVATSPGKPMPNAAIVTTESVHAVHDGSELRISVAPKEGVRLISIRFPAEPQVDLLHQEIAQAANGKQVARHLIDLGVKAGAEQQEVTALLVLESNGKRFGQTVRIPLQPGVASTRAMPKPSPGVDDDFKGQDYPVKEMPAKQEIIRD